MKVSLSWLKTINAKYASSADPAPGGIEMLIEKIGAQLGAVDGVVNLGQRYKGIVIVKIVGVEKHPNADKLTVCTVDDAGKVKNVARTKDGLVQIVCGAPNVQTEMMAVWIPPGVQVPSTFDKEPLVLEAREIRGIRSNGMLASPKELGLGDSHEGLLVIDEKIALGTPFAVAYDLNDYIIDIENKMFTHRPDLFGMLGVARELAGIQNHVFKSPNWYKHTAKVPAGNGRDTHPIKVKNEVPKLVPRFITTVLKDISVKPSPVWLQTYLSRVGVRPINSIVDLTNYFMLETGQPLHAYDYDKVAGLVQSKVQSPKSKAVIGVRLSKAGETLTLLGGKKIKLEGQEIVITDGQRPIGLGGVMGGAETEVNESTKTIILECGTFDMNITRKTAMAYGLFTDAATRFTKGQSPLQNSPVAAKAVADITSLAGGRIAGPANDINHVPSEAIMRGNLHPPVKTSLEFINSRLGLKLTMDKVERLLENVEFKISKSGNNLQVAAPFWRTDIEIPEDVVEEVGRLYGYDHLPLVLPAGTIAPVKLQPEFEFNDRLRNILAMAGGNEILTYSFLHSGLADIAGQDNKDAYHIRNAISPDLQYFRLSLAPSLLEKIHPNIKSGYDQFALFEIGKAHTKKVKDSEGLPKELRRLALVVASKTRLSGAPYYHAKKLAEFLLRELGASDIKFVRPGKADLAWQSAATAFETQRVSKVLSGDRLIGLVGEPNQALKQSLKLPASTAIFEFDIDQLQSAARPPAYKPINRYPELSQDICLRVKTDVKYSEVSELIADKMQIVAKKESYDWSIEPIDIFQKPEDKSHKQITWRITLSHPQRTLTTVEANKVLDELASAAKTSLRATRV